MRSRVLNYDFNYFNFYRLLIYKIKNLKIKYFFNMNLFDFYFKFKEESKIIVLKKV